MTGVWLWVGFGVFIGGMLAVDLGLVNRKAHVISVREAARWTAIVVSMAALFNLWIFSVRGADAGLEFLTGYVIELALSVDNIFVFLVIFSYFRVPRQYQHRVLFWGVLGALFMRGAMIAAGWLLLERFSWITYVFGAFLIFTGVRTAVHQDVDIEPESNPFLKLIRRFVPVSSSYEGQRFFVRAPQGERRRLFATPMLVVLVMVETTDLIFAVDSIPAVFAITRDPFIVFTSNVFAILGLRSMYFLLAGSVDKFHFLKLGMAAVLTFVGLKMVVTYFDVHVPIGISLSVVGLILATSVVASLMFPQAAQTHPHGDHERP
jgi:tellurite resistance protein TerC